MNSGAARRRGPLRRRQGLSGLSSLLAVTSLALLLQVLRYAPALAGLRGEDRGKKLRSSAANLRDLSLSGIRELREKVTPGLTGIKTAVKRATADAQRSAAPLIATAGQSVEGVLIQAGQRIGDLSRRLKNSVQGHSDEVEDDLAQTVEEIQHTRDDAESTASSVDGHGSSSRRGVNIQVAVDLPSGTLHRHLQAAASEIQKALRHYAPELYKAEQEIVTSAAKAIDRIETIAAAANRQIQQSAAAAGKRSSPIVNKVSNATTVQLRKTESQVLKYVRPAATKVSEGIKGTVGAAGKGFQAALKNAKPTLLNISIRGTSTVEALEQIINTLTDAREQLEAAVRPARRRVSATVRPVLAATRAEVNKGVQAVATLADQYLEAVTNEALKRLGIEKRDDALEQFGLEEEEEDEQEAPPTETEDISSDPTSDSKASSTWFGPLKLLFAAAVVGIGAGILVQRRHASQASAVHPSQIADSGPPSGRVTPKTSKAGAVQSPLKGSGSG